MGARKPFLKHLQQAPWERVVRHPCPDETTHCDIDLPQLRGKQSPRSQLPGLPRMPRSTASSPGQGYRVCPAQARVYSKEQKVNISSAAGDIPHGPSECTGDPREAQRDGFRGPSAGWMYSTPVSKTMRLLSREAVREFSSTWHSEDDMSLI